MPATPKRKLIEVSLPLEIINKESARENYIYKGNPSGVHKWWAQRPLATCRAVLFAQLVDDPSAHPDQFRTEEAQETERQRLFRLIERLVVWENAMDQTLLQEVYQEILKSTGGNPPAILDPFAGGGSIPLEAQRLGLESHASDLNPVAVLINKALIEIPPKWAGQPPVFPGAAEEKMGEWPKATGLAEDVYRYGQWMRDEAEKKIGKHYPKAVSDNGSEANAIAWIWARTVTCPNPACGIRMPLTKSWWLGKKKGKEAYVVPLVQNGQVSFSIGHDVKKAPIKDNDGTIRRTGAICIGCGDVAPLTYVRAEGKARRIGQQLMAIAAEGDHRRIYLPPSMAHEEAAKVEQPEDAPDTELPEAALGFRVQGYGMTHHADLFTNRQLLALTTFSGLVREAHEQVRKDAFLAGLPQGKPLEQGGSGAEAYADAIATYLAFVVSKFADYNCALAVWYPQEDRPKNLFARQAIPFVWDFPEIAIFAELGGSWNGCLRVMRDSIKGIPAAGKPATVRQANASTRTYGRGIVISTDPPYYDNIGYADLSDFFYVWLRSSLRDIYPDILGMMLTPKAEELVAEQFRHGGKKEAETFFENGFEEVFSRIRSGYIDDFPISVFYAFKQSESDAEGSASTGWETLLTGMLRSGWMVTGTWPIRTERSGRTRHIDSNALASSIVLACRPRPEDAGTISRKAFLDLLREELPVSLNELQQGAIAPVDLAQAAIGPGMAAFSRYAAVIEADGTPMTVRSALKLINQILDEVLSEQENDFDAETRFCVKWFMLYGWNDADSGTADTLSRAMNTTTTAVERGGVFRARAGRARLLPFEELSGDWDPVADDRISLWEVVLRMAKTLAEVGGTETARLMAAARQRVDLDTAQELAYLLFSLCEKRGLTQDAILFNGLGQSWFDLNSTSLKLAATMPKPVQGQFDFTELSG